MIITILGLILSIILLIVFFKGIIPYYVRNSLFKKIDKNFDGKVSYEEFRHFTWKYLEAELPKDKQTEEILEAAFKKYDLDRDGSLNSDEFVSLVMGINWELSQLRMDYKNSNVSETKNRELEKLNHLREEGYLSEEEYKRHLKENHIT